jgi:hypothetical protein
MGSSSSKSPLYQVTLNGAPGPATGEWGLTSYNSGQIYFIQVPAGTKFAALPKGWQNITAQYSSDQQTATINVYVANAPTPLVFNASHCLAIPAADPVIGCVLDKLSLDKLTQMTSVNNVQSYADDVNKNKQSGLFWFLLIIFLLLVLFLIFRASRR